MGKAMWKKGFALFSVILFIILSTPPAIFSMHTVFERYENGLNSNETIYKNPQEKFVSSMSNYDDDVPIWDVGNSWTYNIEDININYENGNDVVHIHITFGDITFDVTGDTGDFYTVRFKAKLKGDFEVDMEDMQVKVSGRLAKLLPTKIEGIILYRKSDLAIRDINTHLSGFLKARIEENPFIQISLPSVLIPGDLNIDSNFNSPFAILDFPLSTYKLWGISSNSITIDGIINSIWLRFLNIMNKLLMLFDIDLLPPEIADGLPSIDVDEVLKLLGLPSVVNVPPIEIAFVCRDMEELTIEAGTYNAYNITTPIFEEIGNFYYVPEVGKIAKISINGDAISGLISALYGGNIEFSDINIELIETNYK